MRKSTSWYPSLSVEATGSGVVSQAGSVLLLSAAEATDISGYLSAALSPWRKPLAHHDPGKVVLDLAVALALGGDCLADIALLREQPTVFGSVASDPTVSRLITTLAADAPGALRAIDAARAEARKNAWSRAGTDA
ncbi:transposase, partial [Antrihabitans sp. NCIMB 15449]